MEKCWSPAPVLAVPWLSLSSSDTDLSLSVGYPTTNSQKAEAPVAVWSGPHPHLGFAAHVGLSWCPASPLEPGWMRDGTLGKSKKSCLSFSITQAGAYAAKFWLCGQLSRNISSGKTSDSYGPIWQQFSPQVWIWTFSSSLRLLDCNEQQSRATNIVLGSNAWTGVKSLFNLLLCKLNWLNSFRFSPQGWLFTPNIYYCSYCLNMLFLTILLSLGVNKGWTQCSCQQQQWCGTGRGRVVQEALGAHPDLPWLSPLVSHWGELPWQGPCPWVGCQGCQALGWIKGELGFAGLCFCLQLLSCWSGLLWLEEQRCSFLFNLFTTSHCMKWLNPY